MGEFVFVGGVARRGAVVPCRCPDPSCIEWRVGTGDRWRELTRSERIQLTLIQMEDLIIFDVGQIIHRDGGAWARRVLGYDQPTR